MKVPFRKMNGAGNDFVVIDNRDGSVNMKPGQVARVCDRRRGVGADGLILLESTPGYDFFMRFYNADGSEAEMCGNGARCSSVFAASAGLGRSDAGGGVAVRFLTGSGPVEASVLGPDGAGTRARTRLMDAQEMRRGIVARVAQAPMTIHFMVVGTRHAVVVVDDATELTHREINELGREIRFLEEFAPAGANVNFVSVDTSGTVHIRTYEKGVEAETHACATGSVAGAVLLAHLGRCGSPVTVAQRDGESLRIEFTLCDDGAAGVTVEGRAEVNFEGTLEI